jgi:organic radical activating enzyme
MTLKGVIDYDLVDYQKCSMFLAFPYCTFKCGSDYCQNSALALSPNIEVSIDTLLNIYFGNPLTHAIVMGGLEPIDSFADLHAFIEAFRAKTNDDIVIFTGYNEDEIQEQLLILQQYKNIIVKFGRYIPNEEPHFDAILGIDLASSNQYAKRIGA